MGKEDIFEIGLGWLLMTILFTLVFNYILEIPFDRSLLYASVVSAITIIGHELAHLLTAKEYCKIEHSEFVLTKFAIEITIFSIVVMVILIFLKQQFEFRIDFLPIVASPGAVYVENLRQRKCGDEIAIAGPLYNFVVGILGLILLFNIAKPPFILNHSDPWIATLTLTTYFSFALAFFNSLPIKLGSIALDGYHAMTIDPFDKLTKVLDIVILIISIYVIFLSKWWGVIAYV